MHDVRVVLIGGTSNVGKSTVGHAVAEKVGFDCLTTDGLARHPGRPWRTPEWEVPAHVAEHYGSLTVDELIASVLGHYDRLWPRIEELRPTPSGSSVEYLSMMSHRSRSPPDRVTNPRAMPSS